MIKMQGTIFPPVEFFSSKQRTIMLYKISRPAFVICACVLFMHQSTSQTWSQKTDLFASTSTNMSFSANGKGYLLFAASNSFQQYDPSNNGWTAKASFPGNARESAVCFSIGNKGYVGLGRTAADVMLTDFWEYDAIANTWIQKTDFPGGARYLAAGFSIGSKGYMGTGYDGALQSDFWEYDPAGNSWAQKASFNGGGRALAVGFSTSTKGYLATGTSTLDNTGLTNDLWEYDVNANTWTQKTNYPGAARGYAVAFAIGRYGYVGTGSNSINGSGGTLYKDLWEYNSDNNTWASKPNYPGNGSFFLIGFTIGTEAYVGGGEGGAVYSDFWNYASGIVLPVKWGAIKASLRNSDVLVEWNTLMEENTSHYEIEINYGNGFEKIGEIPSENKPNGSQYKFSNTKALQFPGKQILYRIRQIDINGKYSYSEIVSVKIPGEKESLIVKSSLVSDNLTFQFISSKQQTLNIRIQNISGQVVFHNDQNVSKGRNDLFIRITGFSKGIYLISVTNENYNHTEKFIIK